MNLATMPLMASFNPLALLEEDEAMQQQNPTLGTAIGNGIRGAGEDIGQGFAALSDPQALLMGAIQPGLQNLASLAQDPAKSFNDRLQQLMDADEDPERARQKSRARMAEMQSQGQQNYDAGRNFVQLPMGGFVGGANRGLI